MTEEDFAQRLRICRAELLQDVVSHYQAGNRERGRIAFGRWEDRFTAFLEENFPSEAGRFKAATYHITGIATPSEKPYDAFMRRKGRKCLAFIDDLIESILKGRVNLEREHEKVNMVFEDKVSQELLVELRRVLTKHFNKGELQTLCFDLGVDYDDLPGDGRADKARELVSYCERHRCIPKLVEVGRQQRPDISWDNTLEFVRDTSSGPLPKLRLIAVGVNPASLYAPSPELPDIQFTLNFTIENEELASARGVNLGVISWTLGKTAAKINRRLLSYVDLQEPKNCLHEYSLVHFASFSNVAEEIIIGPLDKERTKDFGRFAIPVSESGYIWKAAAYLLTEDSELTWYQLNCDVSTSRQFFNVETRQAIIAFRRLLDTKPLVTWEGF